MNDIAEKAKGWARLQAHLLDDSETPIEQVRQDLVDLGVDVDAAVGRLEETIRLGIQARIVEASKAGIQERRLRLEKLRQKVVDLPAERLRLLREQAEAGRFGAGSQDLAIACRNKDEGARASDEELRVQMIDILAASDANPDDLDA